MSRGSPLASGLNGDPPAQLISQEPNPGVRFEYHLPLGAPQPGFSWSHSSWGDCSAECGGGEGSGLGWANAWLCAGLGAAEGQGCSYRRRWGGELLPELGSPSAPNGV